MSLITISEASRLTGKSDKTLYRHISEGSLSVSQREDGTKLVETSELQRRYGDLGAAREEKRNKERWGNENGDTLELRVENARLSEKVLGLERLIEEKDKRLLTYEMSNSKQVDSLETKQELVMAKEEHSEIDWTKIALWVVFILVAGFLFSIPVLDMLGYEWKFFRWNHG